MGLFESTPYKITQLSTAERAALNVALDIGIKVSAGTPLESLLKKTKRHAKGLAFSTETLIAASACLEATLEALVRQDPKDLRSSMLLQYMAMQSTFESALAKLKKTV